MTEPPTLTALALERLRRLLGADDDRVAIQAVRVALGLPDPDEAGDDRVPVVSLAGLTAEERRAALRALTIVDDIGIRELPRRAAPREGLERDAEEA